MSVCTGQIITLLSLSVNCEFMTDHPYIKQVHTTSSVRCVCRRTDTGPQSESESQTELTRVSERRRARAALTASTLSSAED